jgi:hypothetical protein
MAEKEERILIARSTDYTLTDTDKGELFDGKIAPHCANVITRQEAINHMAKAIFDYYTDGTEPQNWELKEVRDNFNKVAKAALNALLEGK